MFSTTIQGSLSWCIPLCWKLLSNVPVRPAIAHFANSPLEMPSWPLRPHSRGSPARCPASPPAWRVTPDGRPYCQEYPPSAADVLRAMGAPDDHRAAVLAGRCPLCLKILPIGQERCAPGACNLHPVLSARDFPAPIGLVVTWPAAT